MKSLDRARPLMMVPVLLCALGTAIGVWLQVLVTFSLEEDASIARYIGAAAGISVGVLVARYGCTRRGKWWTTLVRMVVFVVLGYPIVGAVLYALAFPTVDREHAHFVAGHFAVFGPIYWLPLLAGLALVERRRASPKAGNRRRLEANARIIGDSRAAVSAIREEHFPHAALEQFCVTWCEVASVLEVHPSVLQLDHNLEAAQLTIDQIEDLHYLLCRESRQLPPPPSPIQTVGDFFRYLYPQEPRGQLT